MRGALQRVLELLVPQRRGDLMNDRRGDQVLLAKEEQVMEGAQNLEGSGSPLCHQVPLQPLGLTFTPLAV